MDIIYAMPNQNHRLFVNLIYACPNACHFCVDFKGDTFYGFDLKNGRAPSVGEIIQTVEKYPLKDRIKEIYLCGIGEPLLRYDDAIELAQKLRAIFSKDTLIAINTSGTHYLKNPKVDFAKHFNLIQVSLNAENEEKYNLICRPKSKGMFQAVMKFLRNLKSFIDNERLKCKVELSVVDTSRKQFLPLHEQNRDEIPQPDISACQKIAESFGWNLKIKSLMTDYEFEEWRAFANALR